MRQDLATYASDLKTEQDHTVSVMPIDLCALDADSLHYYNCAVLPCMAHVLCGAGHF